MSGADPQTITADEPLTPARQLDLKGLNCPLPVLRTKVALKGLEPGQVLKVLTTDPMSVVDLRVFCDRAGHELLRWEETGDGFTFFICRGGHPTG